MKPIQTWNFTKDELEVAEQGIEFEANIINENSPGGYIDSSLGEVESFIKTPPVDWGEVMTLQYIIKEKVIALNIL